MGKAKQNEEAKKDSIKKRNILVKRKRKLNRRRKQEIILSFVRKWQKFIKKTLCILIVKHENLFVYFLPTIITWLLTHRHIFLNIHTYI